jgi:hypothetical protein
LVDDEHRTHDAVCDTEFPLVINFPFSLFSEIQSLLRGDEADDTRSTDGENEKYTAYCIFIGTPEGNQKGHLKDLGKDIPIHYFTVSTPIIT